METVVRKPHNRTKPIQLKIQLTEETRTNFRRAVTKNNTTAQAILEDAILKYIKETGVSK